MPNHTQQLAHWVFNTKAYQQLCVLQFNPLLDLGVCGGDTTMERNLPEGGEAWSRPDAARDQKCSWSGAAGEKTATVKKEEKKLPWARGDPGPALALTHFMVAC